MARGECLTHDTAVIYRYGFVCQRSQTLVTTVICRDSQLMTKFGTLCFISYDGNCTFIYYCVKLVLNVCVQNFCKVFCTETSLEGRFADTDTDHITLSGMHNTLYTVYIAVEFTLEYRLEVGLHVLSSYIYDVSDLLFASYFHLIEVRSDESELVILNLACVFGANQLKAVFSGTVELNLHITSTDDLALECRCEGYRDINLGNLNLNVTCLKRGSVEFGYVFLNDQALRHTEDVLSLVGDYRETKCDSACTASYYYVIQRFECVYECRYTIHGVFHQSACITRCYVTEDQSCTKCYGYNMDYRSHIFAKRYDTKCISHIQSSFYTLVDHITNQSYQNTLCLIALNKLYCFFVARSFSKNNCYTRDISGYQRYTKLTDNGICQMSVIRLCIRFCTIDVFQNLDELCAKCSSNTAHERIIQFLLSGHESFYNAKSFF